MVESVIGLLKQNQRLTQATRCYEGFLSGTQFPTVRLLSPFDILWLFSALMARNTPLAILFSSKPIPGLVFIAMRIFHWLLLAAKEAKTSSVCET